MYKDRSRKSNNLEKSLIDFYTVYFVFSLAIVNSFTYDLHLQQYLKQRCHYEYYLVTVNFAVI